MSAAEVRALLARHGLLARRDLGQNFLVDARVADRLVERAGVAEGDSVVEVGTGLGELTRALAARAARVLTLEVDSGLVRALESEALLPPNVELRHADVMRIDLRALVGALKPPVRLVANLPYVISGPALRRLLDLGDLLEDWSVMIQREVADRLLASPCSRAYGSLGVLHRWTVEVERTMNLAPQLFFPVPKVRSSFLRMRPLRPPLVSAEELPRLERVLRGAFGARRKTLPNALRAAGVAPRKGDLAQVLASLEIEPRVRAEALAPERLLALARALAD